MQKMVALKGRWFKSPCLFPAGCLARTLMDVSAKLLQPDDVGGGALSSEQSFSFSALSLVSLHNYIC